MAAYGILPDPETGGAEVYRDAAGNPTFPDEVQNAYAPPPTFVSSCELTALPANCDGRVEAKQINGIVSEMLSLAECWDPNGPWVCSALNNLCTTFNVWWEEHRPRFDQISITGAGTVADPYHVNIVNGGTNAAPGPQKIQIRRTEVSNDPPTNLLPGELVAEMADPLRLWVGVPAAIDPSLRRLLVPHSSVIVSDTPPPSPIPAQLWWESDSGVMWLWYTDANTSQWVQVSSGGADVPDLPTEADEIVVIPGGNLSANDVQEALIELDAEKVAKLGDTMLGPLVLAGAPTADLQAATKLYVDTSVGSKIGDAPSDGLTYARKNAAWISIEGGTAAGTSFVPAGNVAATNVQAAIVELDTEKLPDAPVNGNTYGRKDGAWVVTAAAGGGPVANAVDIAFSPGGTIAATNVQAGMAELDTEKLAKAGGTMTGAITLMAANPVAATDAAHKGYVDTKAATTYVDAQDALKVAKAGDTMTGHLNLPTGASAAAHAVRKDYVDGGLQLRVAKTGDTMSGQLQITGNAGLVATGHVTTYGWGGDNNKGIVFLNAAQSRYVHFDGSNYSMPGSHLYTAAGRVWGNSDFNYIPANPAGQAFSGAISAPSATFGSATINGGAIYLSGLSGAWNQGVVYFNSNNTTYLHYDGTNFVMTGASGGLVVNGPISSTGQLYGAGNLVMGGWVGGNQEGNNGVRLRTSSGNTLTFYHENPYLKFYVDGIFIKNFVIDHPTDPKRYLIHGCLEGPEAGVYYRGKGKLMGTSVEVELPDYFTALVDEETATVQVTPIMTKWGAKPLAASEVKDGKFFVFSTNGGVGYEQPFHWRVEATRKDVAPLLVEPLKDEINVHGDGPYTYYSKKA